MILSGLTQSVRKVFSGKPEAASAWAMNRPEVG